MTITQLAAELELSSPAEIFTMILKSGIQPEDFFAAPHSVEFSAQGEALLRRFALEKDQLKRVSEICKFRDQLQSMTEKSMRLSTIVDLYLDDYVSTVKGGSK